MTLRPLGDRVIVQPAQAAQQTASGLHLAEHWKPEQAGTVISVGARANGIHEGDYVVFSWNVGQEVFLNDHEQRLIVLRAGDLLAVVEG